MDSLMRFEPIWSAHSVESFEKLVHTHERAKVNIQGADIEMTSPENSKSWSLEVSSS